MEFIKYSCDVGNQNIFVITKFYHNESKYVNAAENAEKLGADNKLMDIPLYYTFAIITHLSPFVEQMRNCKRKFLLIVDISEFPFIASHFDMRDPSTYQNEDQEFHKKVINTWNNYDHDEALTVITNINVPCAMLTQVKLP